MTDEKFGKCPYYTAQSVLHGKWSILIMHYLSGKTLRFNELLKMMQMCIRDRGKGSVYVSRSVSNHSWNRFRK